MNTKKQKKSKKSKKSKKRTTRNKRKFKGGMLEFMPQLCFGTAQGNFETSLEKALNIGYRHIDGADAYSSGRPDYFTSFRRVLEKVSPSIQREDLWITWKGHPHSVEQIIKNISDLGCKYIDLYLIHSCSSDLSEMSEMLDILKQAKESGIIRNYGISNCENIDYIIKLKETYDIYANQIQARPPGGKVNWRPPMDKEFIEKCNSLGIKIMLFGSMSGFSNQPENSFSFIENPSNINKYYLQKYIQGTENVLMVASITGRSLEKNYNNFSKLKTGEKLLTDEEMIKTETELQGITLGCMGM